MLGFLFCIGSLNFIYKQPKINKKLTKEAEMRKKISFLKQIIGLIIALNCIYSLNIHAEIETITEKEKATKLKVILNKHPMQLYESVKKKNRAFCKGFYKALKNASPKITYIEPVVRTDDVHHPALSQYLACDHYDDPSAYIGFIIGELGRRGFRLYRAEMDGHKENGLEEYLYGEDPAFGVWPISARLIKVDLKQCIIREAIPSTPENPVQSKDTHNGFSALIQYQKIFYWYDFSRIGINEDYYNIDIYPYRSIKPKASVMEIKKDIFAHYRKLNVFGAFSDPSICSWTVPHK